MLYPLPDEALEGGQILEKNDDLIEFLRVLATLDFLKDEVDLWHHLQGTVELVVRNYLAHIVELVYARLVTVHTHCVILARLLFLVQEDVTLPARADKLLAVVALVELLGSHQDAELFGVRRHVVIKREKGSSSKGFFSNNGDIFLLN